MRTFQLILVSIGLLLAAQQPSHAQASRTWVSGVGDDANPCSRTAPCKTFAGAISKTAAKGEINVLDPGGFGAVTITKSITIHSESVDAGILASFVNGIIIQAGATDVVELSGLNINGFGNGINGIKIISAGAVHIRKSLIHEFPTAGNAGILIQPTAGNVDVFISDTTLTQNAQGVLAGPTGGATANVVLDRVNLTNINGPAVRANGGAEIRVTNSVITGNNRGLQQGGNGQIISSGNNTLAGNNTDGTFNSTAPLQ
jgi:hypothetical protein